MFCSAEKFCSRDLLPSHKFAEFVIFSSRAGAGRSFRKPTGQLLWSGRRTVKKKRSGIRLAEREQCRANIKRCLAGASTRCRVKCPGLGASRLGQNCAFEIAARLLRCKKRPDARPSRRRNATWPGIREMIYTNIIRARNYKT